MNAVKWIVGSLKRKTFDGQFAWKVKYIVN